MGSSKANEQVDSVGWGVCSLLAAARESCHRLVNSANIDLDVGRRLRLLREDAGLRIDELAPAADLAPSSLVAIEEGKLRPTPLTLARLAALLEAPMTALFDDSLAEAVVATRVTSRTKSANDP